MIKSKLVKSVYGKQRIIDNYKDYSRLYVFKTNLNTYIICTINRISLDHMLEIAGEYHFSTLKEMHNALNTGGNNGL